MLELTTTAKYPAKAAQAIGFLKGHSNDIDIFVEDKASPNMWVKLLRRYLPIDTKLKSVTPLGGRTRVLAACKEDQKPGGRRRLYIIDADFDITLGQKKPALKRLYRLRRYCVENYLLDETAFQDVITSLNPSISWDRAKITPSIAEWTERNEGLLRDIFVSYAVSEKLGAGQQTVSHSCYNLFKDDDSYDFCADKTLKRIDSLYREVEKGSGAQLVANTKIEIEARLKGVDPFVFISAKCYILPPLYELAKRGVPLNASKEVFKTMLASSANGDLDPYLKRRLSTL